MNDANTCCIACVCDGSIFYMNGFRVKMRVGYDIF